jgi:hypothetical protein
MTCQQFQDHIDAIGDMVSASLMHALIRHVRECEACYDKTVETFKGLHPDEQEAIMASAKEFLSMPITDPEIPR